MLMGEFPAPNRGVRVILTVLVDEQRAAKLHPAKARIRNLEFILRDDKIVEKGCFAGC
jgi:hypothetical protein